MAAVNGISHFPRGTRFRELATRIRRDVDRGVLPVGCRLPSVPELARDSGVGVNTVRRAVSVLVEEGLLDRRQGAGTFVIATSEDTRPRCSIGVLVPSLTYYYPQVIAGIEQAASRRNATVVVACSYYDIEREFAELRRLEESGVDGLLLVPSLHRSPDPTEHLARLRELTVPYVLLERRPDPAPTERASYVRTDTMAGAYSAVTHLAGLGRRRIGYIGYLASAPAVDVFDGFVQAMGDLGLERIDSAVVRKRSLTMKDVGPYAELCRKLRLDGVFCLGDPFAATLLGQLRRRGLTVPDDISVVSFDDEFAHTAEIPLTAVSPPKFEIGRLGTELLLRQVELGGTKVAYRVQLQPDLMVRSSCGAATKEVADVVFEATG